MVTRTLLIFAAIAALASAATSFIATIRITNDPYVWGDVTGTVYYTYDTSATAAHKRRINFDLGPIEIILYKDEIRYLYCGSSCNAETYTNAAEHWYPLSTDVATGNTDSASGAVEYTRTGDGDIATVWVLGQQLYKIVYTSGKTIYLTNYKTAAPTASDYTVPASWNCPAKVCNIVMDLVLVCDTSGSIDDTEWASIVSFSNKLIDSFTISASAVNIGIVWFSSVAQIISNLDNSAANLKHKFSSVTPVKEATCIGCGCQAALSVFNTTMTGRASMHPKKVMVLMTDGANNRPRDPSDWSKQTPFCDDHLALYAGLVNQIATSFAIGVGSEVVPEQLLVIAGGQSGNVISVSAYSQLNTILGQIITATCDNIPAEPCGPTCRGFCACNRQCLCPTCPGIDACTLNNCTQGVSWSGCTQSDKYCSDNNACTVDSCDPVTGCTFPPLVCDDGNACTDNLCDTSSGCYFPTHSCYDGEVCTNDDCDSVQGCLNTPISCDDGDLCTDDVCVLGKGCKHTPVTYCDDNNLCTLDSCVPATGLCVHNDVTCTTQSSCISPVCIPSLGCTYPLTDCDDNLTCTADDCVEGTGCTHRDVPCTGCRGSTPLVCVSSSPCNISRCRDLDTTGNNMDCVSIPKMNIPGTGCNSNNPCILDFCNDTTGICNHQPVTCSHNPCFNSFCSLELGGMCKGEPYNCTSGDPCNPGICNPLVDSCQTQPACEDQPCNITHCSVVGGAAVCTYTPIDCDAGTKCLHNFCNVTSGQCYHTPLDCDDQNNCTIDSCNATSGCVHVLDLCDDKDPCTDDLCNALTGCKHTAHCNDSLWCTDDSCTTTGDCIHTDKTCDEVLSGDNDKSCYIGYCTEKQHCRKKVVTGAFTNPCGGCMKTFATSSERADNTCVGALTWPAFAGALAGGIIAAIVIAALIGAAILAALASAATYKLVQLAKHTKHIKPHNNPIYKGSENEFYSAAYNPK